MHKVVYSSCYGGFSLSLKAIDWLEANCTDNELRKFIRATRSKILSSLSREIFCCDISDWFEGKRHHKDLIAVVEALGSEANGSCADLAIAHISGRQYRIEEYDGAEEVVTPEGSDWIIIQD